MAKSYTSTLAVKCWKQHECAGCGAKYSYLLMRKAVGKAGTPEKARVRMQKRVVAITQGDTDMHPCPGCGLYQYDMIGQRRAKSRLQFFWITLVAVVTVIILRACYALPDTTLTWIAAAVCGFVILAHLLLETSNSNRDLDRNKQKAQQEITEGKLRFTPATVAVSQSDELARPGRSIIHLIMLLLLVVSLGLVLAPEGALGVHHWPVNAECYPPVVGPTDKTRVYMPGTITSIKSYWRGDPHVSLHYDGSPPEGQDAQSTTNQNNWGSTISDVKSDEEASHSHPWVELTLPDSPGLTGKSVQCDINLSLEFPQMSGGSNFTTVNDQMSHSLNIAVAPSGAGAKYNALWWAGTAGGGGLILFASLMLYYSARRFQKLAKPTQVFAAE